MGFDLFIQWFQHGVPAPVSYQAIRAVFGAAAGPDDEFGFPVAYGPANDSFVYATPDSGGVVAHIMISRPCSAPALWDSLAALLRLGNGFSYWPGEATAVAHSGVIAHLPEDFKSAPQPTVVEDGAAFIKLVESS